MSKNECIQLLKEILPALEREYSLSYLGLFGSFASNTFREKSDVDVLVSFTKPPSLFQLVEIEKKIKAQLNRKVDVILKKAVDSDFYNRISKDLIEIKK